MLISLNFADLVVEYKTFLWKFVCDALNKPLEPSGIEVPFFVVVSLFQSIFPYQKWLLEGR